MKVTKFKVRLAIFFAGVFGVFVFAVFCGEDFPDPSPLRDDFDQRGQNSYSNYEMVDRQRRNQRSWSEGRTFLGWKINIQGLHSPDS